MIKNEFEYEVTKSRIKEFTEAIQDFSHKRDDMADVHPLLVQALEDGLKGQLNSLESDLTEYESANSDKSSVWSLEAVENLPETLIQTRIAQGLTQKDLAMRLGLKLRHIRRYEATNFPRPVSPQ